MFKWPKILLFVAAIVAINGFGNYFFKDYGSKYLLYMLAATAILIGIYYIFRKKK